MPRGTLKGILPHIPHLYNMRKKSKSDIKKEIFFIFHDFTLGTV